MKYKKILIGLLAIAFLTSAIFTANVKAATFPNLPLPPTTVTLTSVLHQNLFPGPGTMFYFDDILTNVPAGYDVTIAASRLDPKNDGTGNDDGIQQIVVSVLQNGETKLTVTDYKVDR